MKVFSCLALTSCLCALTIGTSLSFHENALRKSIKSVLQGGKPGRIFTNVVKDLDLKDVLRDSSIADTWSESKINSFCLTCVTLFTELINIVEAGASYDFIQSAAIRVCITAGYGSEHFCNSFIPMVVPDFQYIYQNTPDLTGKDFCGTMFSHRGCVSNNPDRDWTVTLPDVPKPDIEEPPLMEDLPTMRVLHLSDSHVDLQYTPGVNTSDCPEEYLCCRPTEDTIDTPGYYGEEAAGYWGDYRSCDLPVWSLEELYRHIAETHKDIDFIIMTGDLIPHNVWETSKEGNLQIINGTVDLLLRYFPNTTVFPAVGNHEASPVNSFPQPYVTDPNFDISWLYDTLAAAWANWVPEVAEEVSYGAFYSAYAIDKKLRIISINSQYCYTMNWWLVMDSHDVADQLNKLAKELQDAEDHGEYVYIIGHIPPGASDCQETWSREYNKIIFRYEHTISGIFYGHTHKDHFQLFFEPGSDTTVPYEIAYIGQSQTTYSEYNPGYKIYTIEGNHAGSRYRVVDHHNYVFDLERSNKYNVPSIFRLYSAKQEYGMTDLSPRSWAELVYTAAEEDNPLFNILHRNYLKASPVPISRGCNDGCKRSFLCGLLVSDSSDQSHCDVLNV